MEKRTALALVSAVSFTFALLAWGLGSRASAEEAAADGKAIFLAQKCNMCHSVPLMTHDLEKDQLVKFIKKEVKNNEDKMHGKEWKGTDAELNTLTDWLLANKRPA
jgi:cytochrome c551/c552